jgi:metal-dependent hydrolase (beta-lactamase superfamily II)
VAYVIQARLMMIDALGATDVESRLLPGFHQTGLDPSQVKTILIAHGHADHLWRRRRAMANCRMGSR